MCESMVYLATLCLEEKEQDLTKLDGVQRYLDLLVERSDAMQEESKTVDKDAKKK